jgi:subtilisin family serine protease
MSKTILYMLGISLAAYAAQQPKFQDQETRKKIVVLDTPIASDQKDQPYMCKNGTVSSQLGHPSYLSKLEQSLVDYKFRHGENVVNIIASRMNREKYCIYHIAWFHPGEENVFGQTDKAYYTESLKMILALKNVSGLNMSLAGPNMKQSYVEYEFQVLNAMTERGVKIVVAAGNDNTDLTKDNCFTYPACLQKKVKHPENFYVVGGIKVPWSLRRPVSNKSEYLKIDLEEWVNQGDPEFSGTSQATANFTSKLFSK